MDHSEVLKTVKDFQKRYADVMKKGDCHKLVTTFYHPHAVSVRRGAGACYGHDEITKFYEMCLKSCPTDCGDVETSYEWYDQAGNGEYLLVHSHFWPVTKPKQKMPCDMILKRKEDGSYVIYHEEFEMPTECSGGAQNGTGH